MLNTDHTDLGHRYYADWLRRHFVVACRAAETAARERLGRQKIDARWGDRKSVSICALNQWLCVLIISHEQSELSQTAAIH